MIKASIIVLIALLVHTISWSQTNTRDSINNLLKNTPQFTIFRDNYFITGLPLNGSINAHTADAKFQISFKERLTNAALPFDSFLYFTYTQKAFWDIYKVSSPFAEVNYNPALGIGKLYLNKYRLLNLAGIGIEHESNGKDSINSRSWNKVSFYYMYAFPSSITLSLTAWIPFAYKTDNADLMKYIGYLEAVFTKKSRNGRFIIEITTKKGAVWDEKGSLQAQLYFRIGKNNNQYLSVQYFTGYAESLIHYREKTNMIRFGMVFRPSKFFLDE